MYEYIFESKIATLILGLVIAMISFCIINGFKNSFQDAVRLLIYSFPPIFGLGYLVSALFSDSEINKIDLLACLVFEYAIFAVQVVVFVKIKNFVYKGMDLTPGVKKRICILFFVLLVIDFYILNPLSYTTSRLDYLSVSSFNKYITYFSILYTSIMAVFVAGHINKNAKLTKFDVVILFFVFCFSIMTGSKGAFFLFVLQIMSLLNYRRYNISFSRVIIAGGCLSILFLASGFYISQKNGISLQEFISLGVSRFFLSNDARALAFDYRFYSEQPSISELLANSFRSIAVIIGHPPTDPPLGNLLFQYLYHQASSNGANTSISALILYYSKDGEAILSALLLLAILLPIILLLYLCIRFVKEKAVRLSLLASLYLCLTLMVQDFLSFQLIMIIFFALFTLLLGIAVLQKASWRHNEFSHNNNSQL
ncbi:hypothetical protein N4G41_00870 [Kosakonia sacchari]|uniref:hypothetical protein n=1 Tax=Kosakonia sacchari TaxID=1158459 RepID=UPI002ACE2927|nr:hypothetical protein [Kosakonia sacchari]MDZ7320183.1 hypothetical protein [Kosakonia sacchari]